MREYGKVHCAFWTSETVRSMSEDGRHLSLYLLTCGHANMLGVFRVPDAYAAEDLQWSAERVREGFRNASSKGFATRDDQSGWVVIHGYLDYNPIENPNQGKGALKAIEALPRSLRFRPAMALDLADACMKFKDKLGGGFFNRLETLSKPYRNQEQEQEQEQESSTVVDDGATTKTDESEFPVLELPTCAKGIGFLVTRSMLERCVENYPRLDVHQQLRNMRGWLDGEPQLKRPTQREMTKFINSWLKRETNKLPPPGEANENTQRPDGNGQHSRRLSPSERVSARRRGTKD